MGYVKLAARGVSWVGALRGFTRVVAFGKIAILTRLLAPEQFGIVGIAILAVSFLEVFTDTGINIFLIQEKEKIDRYVNTAWLVSILRAVFIFLILALAAPLIAGFFGSPEAQSLLVLAGFVALIRGFINPSVVKLQKNLLFKREFYFRFSIFILDAVVAISIALIFKTASSIVWGMVAGALLEVIISHLVIRPRPRFKFEAEKIKTILGRGKWITASRIFEYLFRETDDIAVGRVLNASSLGIYQVAYKISSLPITEVANVVTRVTFPIYVKISHDSTRLKRAFVRVLLAVFVLTVPFGVFLFTLSDPLVTILLGNSYDWSEVVPVIKVLALFGVARALTSVTYPLFNSVKKQEYTTYVTLAGVLGLAITILPLVRTYGIVGAGISALIGSLVAVPIAIFFTLRLFKYHLK